MLDPPSAIAASITVPGRLIAHLDADRLVTLRGGVRYIV